MKMNMTVEEALNIWLPVIKTGVETMPECKEALNMSIKALETSEEFEKAQIITGGRLNGRTHAYKCGLEDGARKALEQESKTAHWVYKIYGGFHEQGDWYCSHCDYRYNYGEGHAKYCPECGYEMSEPPTEEVIRDKNYDWVIKRR